MSFEIVIAGTPHSTVRKRIVDLIGSDRVAVESDCVVVRVPDQPAAVGAIHAINDLGCEIASMRARADPE